ncbi:MAG: hypothetical protein AAF840_06445 [Bacteroidota bacterium]
MFYLGGDASPSFTSQQMNEKEKTIQPEQAQEQQVEKTIHQERSQQQQREMQNYLHEHFRKLDRGRGRGR